MAAFPSHPQRVRSWCGPHFTLLVTLRHLSDITKSSEVTWSLCRNPHSPHPSASCTIETRVKALLLRGQARGQRANPLVLTVCLLPQAQLQPSLSPASAFLMGIWEEDTFSSCLTPLKS